MKISWSNDADLHQKRWGQFAPENWGQFAPAKWGQFTPEYGGQVCRILQVAAGLYSEEKVYTITQVRPIVD